ncbi:MAG: Smr/MutS family protein [Casimicrobiaceae bacterium]|nr:Smr/MutS family protein [Casimicrobiaceae bacterium]MCX8098898.1 Smr/MutS family protein [Casimicrobiaceae bacterium]MDW8312212.1 Smr/MutS family protein [Burkholderiales bacterium]
MPRRTSNPSDSEGRNAHGGRRLVAKELTALRKLLEASQQHDPRTRTEATAAASRAAARAPAGPREQGHDASARRSRLTSPSEEVEWFRQAMADVEPLVTQPRADTRRVLPQPVPRKRYADEAAALQASRLALDPSPASGELDLEEEQSYLRPGTNPDLLRKLRRGQWKIEAELDLHHHTQLEAYEALVAFLRSARTQGWRCVRVIHGKGRSSYQRQPVLRGRVRRWLTRFADVVAYCEPRENLGGAGALLVLLKGR